MAANVRAVVAALKQGKLHRVPKAWLREAHRHAVETRDDGLRTACVLALNNYPNPTHAVAQEIQRLAGSVYVRPQKG